MEFASLVLQVCGSNHIIDYHEAARRSTAGGGRLEVLLLRILWLPSSYPEEKEWDPAQRGLEQQ